MAFTRALRQLLSRCPHGLLTACVSCFIPFQNPEEVHAIIEPTSTSDRWHVSVRFTLLISIAAFMCLASLPMVNSAPAQNVPNADLLEMKGEFLKKVNDEKNAVAKNQDLLWRAQTAHQQAIANGDVDGGNVTAEAIGNAQAALDKAKQNLFEDQRRLDAVNQAMVLWTSVGDSMGPRALATKVRGQVTVDTPQGPKPFDPYAPVHPGEHIHIGPNAFLELQLGNRSEMHLGPNSDFEYERDVHGIQWELFKGEMHKITIIMGVRGANDNALYRGPTTICAVRGTDFTLSTDGNQDTVTVLEGAVEVDPGSGRPKVTLTGGQQLIVPKSGAIGSVTAFDPNALQRWWEK